ncbi:alpha/beta hydrolase family protein [Rhodanobacter sp. Si-c]|uniref:Alpha/beta hydrolase family protein n=1 Tax=Rhodanobacter lycopersici TaxID=3162487 RepID=A0ABV3QDV8_9GAMM
MRQFRLITLGVVLLVCCDMVAPTTSAADTQAGSHAGTLQGAPYRIDVPAHWNGDLVMLMHGYEPAGAPRATPMKPADETAIFLKRGYAVAQSDYASQGWAVGDAIVDNERLRQFAGRSIGHPRHTYLVGFSLGALEAVASLERHPHTYAGALLMCGATVSTPELIARGTLTPLVAFDALIPGVLPDLAAADAPAFVPPGVFAQALKAHPEQAAILERRLQETPESLPTLSLYYMVLRELERRAGGMPVDNRKTVYRGFGDDAAFNRRVHRYAGSPAALAYARRNVSLSGHIDAPVVMEWNAFDQTIPSRLHGIYPDQVRAAGNGRLLTVLAPVGQGHCAFSNGQIGAAFGTLLSKVATAGH